MNLKEIQLTNIFCKDFLASQQFKNTGINKFLKGGYNSWKTERKLLSFACFQSSLIYFRNTYRQGKWNGSYDLQNKMKR